MTPQIQLSASIQVSSALFIGQHQVYLIFYSILYLHLIICSLITLTGLRSALEQAKNREPLSLEMKTHLLNELDQFFAVEFTVPKEAYEDVFRRQLGKEFKFTLTQTINLRCFPGTNETCPFKVTFI